jgi:hypothetical protein
MFILKYLPWRRTLGPYARRATQFYMFPESDGNISFLRNRKEARKQKDLFT